MAFVMEWEKFSTERRSLLSMYSFKTILSVKEDFERQKVAFQ